MLSNRSSQDKTKSALDISKYVIIADDAGDYSAKRAHDSNLKWSTLERCAKCPNSRAMLCDCGVAYCIGCDAFEHNACAGNKIVLDRINRICYSSLDIINATLLSRVNVLTLAIKNGHKLEQEADVLANRLKNDLVDRAGQLINELTSLTAELGAAKNYQEIFEIVHLKQEFLKKSELDCKKYKEMRTDAMGRIDSCKQLGLKLEKSPKDIEDEDLKCFGSLREAQEAIIGDDCLLPNIIQEDKNNISQLSVAQQSISSDTIMQRVLGLKVGNQKTPAPAIRQTTEASINEEPAVSPQEASISSTSDVASKADLKESTMGEREI